MQLEIPEIGVGLLDGGEYTIELLRVLGSILDVEGLKESHL